MKKCILILFLVCIVILTGCADGVAKLSDNSNITSTHFEEDLNSTSEVSSKEIEAIKTETSSSQNASSDIVITEVVEYTEPEPEWLGHLLQYGAEVDPTYDTFIEWAKSGGTIWRGEPVETSEYQQPFIEWTKQSKEVVLPKFKKDGYHLHNIKAIQNSKSIDIVFCSDEPYEKVGNKYNVNIVIFPKSKKEISLSIEELGEKQYKNDNTEEYIVDTKNCPYGDCYRSPDSFSCWFKYKNYLVYARIYAGEYAEFTPDLFDYFELETVSLE